MQNKKTILLYFSYYAVLFRIHEKQGYCGEMVKEYDDYPRQEQLIEQMDRLVTKGSFENWRQDPVKTGDFSSGVTCLIYEVYKEEEDGAEYLKLIEQVCFAPPTLKELLPSLRLDFLLEE